MEDTFEKLFKLIENLLDDIPEKEHNNGAYIVRKIRQRMGITCRELSGILKIPISKVSDAEHGRVIFEEDYYMAVIFACCARSIAETVNERETCPDCGRAKAKDAHEVLKGFCPKWWAINDIEAAKDCKNRQKIIENESVTRQF